MLEKRKPSYRKHTNKKHYCKCSNGEELICVKDVPEEFIPIIDMNLSSSGINNGIIDMQYGALSKNKLGEMPLVSLPLEWSRIPCKTMSYAITIINYDTVPIMGFPWIHWLIANIPCCVTSLPANSSRRFNENFEQGINSFASGYPLLLRSLRNFQVPKEEAFFYGGMLPMNYPHKYTIKIYALDIMLELENGFPLNELLDKMDNHILGIGTLSGIYKAKITEI